MDEGWRIQARVILNGGYNQPAAVSFRISLSSGQRDGFVHLPAGLGDSGFLAIADGEREEAGQIDYEAQEHDPADAGAAELGPGLPAESVESFNLHAIPRSPNRPRL